MIRPFGYAALAIAGLLGAATSKGGEIATATLSQSSLGGGEFQYNLTLNDAGSTTLGTFWFAWIPGDNFMPADPTNILSPTGWQDLVTTGGPSAGYAIQWTAATAGADLTAGNSLSGFGFVSTLTLAQLEAPSTGNPADAVDTAFVYSGAPFSDVGFQLTATATAAPEPSSIFLSAGGLGALLLLLGRRRVVRP
jgi:hypothetical protein